MGNEDGAEAAREPVREVLTPGEVSRDNGDEATRILDPGELLLASEVGARTAELDIRCGAICA